MPVESDSRRRCAVRVRFRGRLSTAPIDTAMSGANRESSFRIVGSASLSCAAKPFLPLLWTRIRKVPTGNSSRAANSRIESPSTPMDRRGSPQIVKLLGKRNLKGQFRLDRHIGHPAELAAKQRALRAYYLKLYNAVEHMVAGWTVDSNGELWTRALAAFRYRTPPVQPRILNISISS